MLMPPSCMSWKGNSSGKPKPGGWTMSWRSMLWRFFGRVLMSCLILPGAGAWASVRTQPAQPDRVEWLRENGVAVKTLDMYPKDLSDLMPLKAALGDPQA